MAKNLVQFGKQLKHAREMRDISQTELARLASSSASRIHQLENYDTQPHKLKHGPRADLVRNFCRVLGLDVNQMLNLAGFASDNSEKAPASLPLFPSLDDLLLELRQVDLPQIAAAIDPILKHLAGLIHLQIQQQRVLTEAYQSRLAEAPQANISRK